MSLEDVIEDIIKQANSTAQNILKEAEEDAKRIVSKTSAESAGQVEKFDEETREVIEEKRNSEILSAKIEQKRMILAAKKMATENIFDAVKQKLSKISDKEREVIIKALIEKSKHELKDAKYVYSNSTDKKFAGKHGLEFAGIISCIGGIIVENSDKKVRVNMTFDRLFEDFKEGLDEEIAKVFA